MGVGFARYAAADCVSLQKCANLSEDGSRLACYDRLMERFGSAMVKACVDEDLDAYRGLARYPDEHRPCGVTP